MLFGVRFIRSFFFLQRHTTTEGVLLPYSQALAQLYASTNMTQLEKEGVVLAGLRRVGGGGLGSCGTLTFF